MGEDGRSATAHDQDQDPDENVYPVFLSEAEVEDGIRNDTIFDAKTLAAWACDKLDTATPRTTQPIKGRQDGSGGARSNQHAQIPNSIRAPL